MRCKAVIFDLFGTLIPNSFSWSGEMNRRVADALGADRQEFLREWARTSPMRTTGKFPSIEDNLRYVAARLRLAPSPVRLMKAVRLRFEYTRRAFVPKPLAVETLRALRKRKIDIGLISNASPETAIFWPSTVFAPFFKATLFSCVEGIRKPNPRIYQLALERLRREAAECMYVADGERGELRAAKGVGMQGVLILDHDRAASPSKGEAATWRGPTITTLGDVLLLLD